MKNGNVMGFRGYRFFSPKRSKAKYKTLGTSGANFGGKKPRIILREVRYKFPLQGDGLKLTFHKRAKGRQERPGDALEAEKGED